MFNKNNRERKIHQLLKNKKYICGKPRNAPKENKRKTTITKEV